MPGRAALGGCCWLGLAALTLNMLIIRNQEIRNGDDESGLLTVLSESTTVADKGVMHYSLELSEIGPVQSTCQITKNIIVLYFWKLL